MLSGGRHQAVAPKSVRVPHRCKADVKADAKAGAHGGSGARLRPAARAEPLARERGRGDGEGLVH